MPDDAHGTTATTPQSPSPTTALHSTAAEAEGRWWRKAVVYQVYVRSFADANGDGVGDLAGVRARLPYLRDLGVDALWFSPWYPSPLADTGYDIADYRAIDPAFGTLAEAEQLIAEARASRDPHRSSTSSRTTSPTSTPGSRQRSRLRPDRPSASASGSGRARARTASCRRTAGSRSSAAPRGRARRRRRCAGRVVPPPVRARAARPQLDARRRLGRARGRPPVLVRPGRRRSADRLGGAARQGSGPRRGGAGPRDRRAPVHRPRRAPRHLPPLARDRRRLRRAAPARRRGLAARRRTVRPLSPPGRAAHCFQLRLPRVSLGAGADAHVDRVHARRARSGGCADDVGALEPRRDPARYALRPRPTRRSRSRPSARARRPISSAAPGARGPRRCSRWRCPARCTSTRARSSGCRRSRTSRPSAARTRCGIRSGGVDPGRDGCRIPLPWGGDRPPYGFSPDGADRPWLDQPDDWARLTVAAQAERETSMLALYRAAFASVAQHPGRRRRASLASLDRNRFLRSRAASASPASSTSVLPGPAPAGGDVLIASDELEGGELPHDTYGLAPPGERRFCNDNPRSDNSMRDQTRPAQRHGAHGKE